MEAQALRDLLDRDLLHQRAGAGAAVLGEGKPEDVLLGQQLADVPRVLAGRVDLGSARADLRLGDLADHVPEVPHLLRELVDALCGRGRAHGREATRRPGTASSCSRCRKD